IGLHFDGAMVDFTSSDRGFKGMVMLARWMATHCVGLVPRAMLFKWVRWWSLIEVTEWRSARLARSPRWGSSP
ncbi:MAG: hypothetical protein ORN51_01900, partial [Akkermansiaceae bacterium]|nr:hypothetical protein [Akkermansiaceae bacterium]